MSVSALNPTQQGFFPRESVGLSSFVPLQTIFDRVVKNPFFWALVLSTAVASTITFAALTLPVSAAAGVSALALTMLTGAYFIQSEETRKWIYCEFSLLSSTLLTSLMPARLNHTWYTKIDEHITLGANPLKNRGHLEALKQTGHTAVLSLIQKFESDPHLFWVPLQEEDWTREGITFLNLPNPDLTPVIRRDIELGVEFLHQQISRGGRVYVHCQAGVGRSATIVVCYLIRHHNMTPKDAVNYVRSKRRIVVHENSHAIQAFLQRA